MLYAYRIAAKEGEVGRHLTRVFIIQDLRDVALR
jgi:hypothetical protein